MEIAIKDHCDNSSNNGLFLLDMPTGYGKTYSDMKGPYVKAQKALFSLFLVFSQCHAQISEWIHQLFNPSDIRGFAQVNGFAADSANY